MPGARDPRRPRARPSSMRAARSPSASHVAVSSSRRSGSAIANEFSSTLASAATAAACSAATAASPSAATLGSAAAVGFLGETGEQHRAPRQVELHVDRVFQHRLQGHEPGRALFLGPVRHARRERHATLEPETAFTASSSFERSAASASAAPGISLGFRLTSRRGSPRPLSSLISSLPIAPPAPRMVTMLRMLRPVEDHFNGPTIRRSTARRFWQDRRPSFPYRVPSSKHLPLALCARKCW